MRLTDFTLDIKNTDYQPIMIHSVGKNAFLILVKFKSKIKRKVVRIRKVKFKIKHINNDTTYNRIGRIRFYKKTGTEPYTFIICMSINNTPYPRKIKRKKVNIKLRSNEDETVEFHLNYRCNKGGTIGSLEWPCNKVCFG